MSDNKFVNRRGHRANLNQIDLSDMSIDDEITSDQASIESKPPTPKASRSFQWTRKKAYITLAIVAFIIIIPVLVGELITLRYNSGANSVHKRLADLVSTKVLPSQKKPITANVLKSTVEDLDKVRAAMCEGGLTDNIASLYPRAKSAHESCIKKSEQVSSLSNRVKQLENETRYIEALLSATASVTTPVTEQYAVIDAQLTNWQTAKDKVGKLNAPNQWKARHSELLKQVTAAADAWSTLNAAQNARDKAGFEGAEKTLTSSYEGIRTSIHVLVGDLYQSQNALTNARKSLQI